MYLPTEFSTKMEMLLFLKSKGPKAARQVAKLVNANKLSSYEVCQTEDLDEILMDLKAVEKAVLWEALSKACPELVEADCDDESETDHDCDEDDDE